MGGVIGELRIEHLVLSGLPAFTVTTAAIVTYDLSGAVAAGLILASLVASLVGLAALSALGTQRTLPLPVALAYFMVAVAGSAIIAIYSPVV